MTLKRVLLTFMSMTLIISVLSVTASAENRNQSGTIQPMYEIARSPLSTLSCIDTNATCFSNSSSKEAKSITAIQTLQKLQDQSWMPVDDAEWTSTVNSSSISVRNTKEGLAAGTYRLKTDFTLTDKNGNTETITVYSGEKTVA